MSGTNTKSGSDLSTAHAVETILKDAGFTMEEVELTGDDDSSAVGGSLRTLQSALAALSEGRVSEVVKHFDEDGCFRFSDHALTLEFTDKPRVTEFFEKSRELFPDTAPEQTAHAYGANTGRLQQLKRRFDPDGVFSSAISLPLQRAA